MAKIIFNFTRHCIITMYNPSFHFPENIFAPEKIICPQVASNIKQKSCEWSDVSRHCVTSRTSYDDRMVIILYKAIFEGFEKSDIKIIGYIL